MLEVEGWQLSAKGDILRDIEQNEILRSSAATFLAKTAPPVSVSGDRHVLVRQSEEAGITYEPGESVVIGSEEATTCLIAIVVCPVKRQAWCAHYDNAESCRESQLMAAIPSLEEPHLFLVGSYQETSGSSIVLARTFLTLVHRLPKRVHLDLACIHAFNTAADGSPAAQHLLLRLPSREPTHHAPGYPIPEDLRRSLALSCSGDGLVCIAIPQSPVFSFPGYDPRINPRLVKRYKQLLSLPDQQLLQITSTSPAHELPGFAARQREQINWLLDVQADPGDIEEDVHYMWVPGKGYLQVQLLSAVPAAATT